jgi:hypothetical protein
MDSEISKLRAEKLAAQKNLLKEREEKQKLLEKLEESDSQCKRKTQEIEALQLCNYQLVQKCETLQEKLNRKSKTWSNSWWPSNAKSDKFTETIVVLQQDLQNKILENEQVHIKNFEIRQKYKNKIKDIKNKIRDTEQYLRDAGEKIDYMGIEISQYQTTVQNLFNENKEYSKLIETKNKEIQDSHNYFIKVTNDFKQKIGYLQTKLRSVISLDLSEYENYSSYNAPKYNRVFQSKQNEWLNKIWLSAQKFVPVIKSLLKNYCLRLDIVYNPPNPLCKKILLELNVSSGKFAGLIEELVNVLSQKSFENSVAIKVLNKIRNCSGYFFRLLTLELQLEQEIISGSENYYQVNKDLCDYLAKIEVLMSRGIGLVVGNAHTKHSLLPKIQDIAKSLTNVIIETNKTLVERLSLDRNLKYKNTVKDTQNLNDDIISDLQKLSVLLNHICSEIIQLRSNFYYCLNPLYQNTVNYLQDLRKIPNTPGIPYSQSLENVKFLQISETKIKDQLQTISILEKQNSILQKDIEKYKEDITKIENELAAVEQNLERKNIEFGKDILHEPESLSEDVKNGAQRFALRLSDFNGEPIPISTLTVKNDLYLKIQELAINKINELSERIKNTSK